MRLLLAGQEGQSAKPLTAVSYPLEVRVVDVRGEGEALGVATSRKMSSQGGVVLYSTVLDAETIAHAKSALRGVKATGKMPNAALILGDGNPRGSMLWPTVNTSLRSLTRV